jgi:hypothetical protein
MPKQSQTPQSIIFETINLPKHPRAAGARRGKSGDLGPKNQQGKFFSQSE